MLGVDPPLFVSEPPAPPSSHTADVAPPPKEPPSAEVVPPWHMEETAAPTVKVGAAEMVMVFVDTASVQPALAVAVNENVRVPADISAALRLYVHNVSDVAFVNDPVPLPVHTTPALLEALAPAVIFTVVVFEQVTMLVPAVAVGAVDTVAVTSKRDVLSQPPTV